MNDDELIRRGDAMAVTVNEYLRAKIAALPAVQTGVRKLEWIGSEADGHDVIARPDPYHTYTVRRLATDRFDVILNHETGSLWFKMHRGEVWPDYAAAKVAAQADYEARIRSALTVQPAPVAPDVAGLVAALVEAREEAHSIAHSEFDWVWSEADFATLTPLADAILAALEGKQ